MKTTLLIIAIGLISLINAKKIPDYIHVCKRTDPQIDVCVKNSILSLRGKLAEGLSDLKVESIEPLVFDKVAFVSNPDSVLTNLKIYGLSKFDIEELKAEIDKPRFATILKIPEVTFSANCKLNLKILAAQVQGEGVLNGKFTNLKVSTALKGKKVKKDGVDYVKFKPSEAKLFVDKAEFKLKNLFGTQRALNQASEDLLNDNPQPFLDEFLPSLEKAVSDKFTETANMITAEFTYDDLFPEK